jgi:hypothetical protein
LKSYGDRELISEAPAHLFLDFEGHDLISLSQIALGMGWDFRLLTNADYSRIFISHDEWFSLCVRDNSQLNEIIDQLRSAKINPI